MLAAHLPKLRQRWSSSLCQHCWRNQLPRRYLATHASTSHIGTEHDVGSQIHGFTLQRTKVVPELQLKAYQLQHDVTGAEFVHIAREDENNVFSIGFKTNPPDATGVPHILEHTTLCGSQKYPVRDPFFKMLRRSLANFMNAFTTADHTMYPFATTNVQDYKNLLSVYLDATLRPLLRESDFRQEGWRLGPGQSNSAAETAQPKSEDSYTAGKPQFKGVVYNEMKGQMSDVGYLFYTKFQDHMFPAIKNSGGDPSKITDLTYDHLRSFHQEHYHPSNSRIYTYGSIALAEHARLLNETLSDFQVSKIDREIKEPLSFYQNPKEIIVPGPHDPMLDAAAQHKTSISWTVGPTSDIVETFAFGIISSLLSQGYGTPLYRALIESGLGTDYTSNTGFDGSGKIGIFSVGLNGVREADLSKVKRLIHETIAQTVTNGFERQKVEGILCQLDLALRHKNAEFGLELVQKLQSAAFNGIDSLQAIAWNETIDAFKAKYSHGGYLEGLLDKYLNNNHTLTFTMSPSSDFQAKLEKDEQDRLTAKFSEVVAKSGGEQAALEHLAKEEAELLAEQMQAPDQDLSSLPTLHIEDIPQALVRPQINFTSLGPVRTQWRVADTNGLTYIKAIHNLGGLPQDLRMLIPLFTSAVMRLGTRTKSVEEVEDLIKLKTGGISFGYHSSSSPTDFNNAVEGIALSASALDCNVSAALELLRMLFQETNFDGSAVREQIYQLLQADASGALDAVAASGNAYARRYAESGITRQALLNEQVGGLTQVQQTLNFARRGGESGMSDLVEKLKTIQSLVASNTSSLRVAVTCEQNATRSNEEALQGFLASLPATTPCLTPSSSANAAKQKTFFPLPYQVSYAAASLPTVSYCHPDSAPLQILAQLLTHKHLHHEIREKGGAYGGGAYSRGLSGVFGFYSYRDPDIQNTLKIIRQAGRWAFDKSWTDADLAEAKLCVFQGLDAPRSINEEGMTLFLHGIEDGMEDQKRAELLGVTREDVRRVTSRYLIEGAAASRVAILGPRQDWVESEDGWAVKELDLADPLS